MNGIANYDHLIGREMAALGMVIHTLDFAVDALRSLGKYGIFNPGASTSFCVYRQI